MLEVLVYLRDVLVLSALCTLLLFVVLVLLEGCRTLLSGSPPEREAARLEDEAERQALRDQRHLLPFPDRDREEAV